MNPVLQDVQRFCDSTTRVSLQPGTLYAGVAIVQATPFDGLRILLDETNRSQLPTKELCTFTTSTTSRLSDNTGSTTGMGDDLVGSVEDIGEALTWLEGMNLLSIIGRNVAISSSPSNAIGGPVVTALLRHIERAIVPMLDSMLSQDDMAHVIPRLALHPVLVPLTPHRPRSNNSPSTTGYIPPYMIVLYANYDAAVNTFTDKWLPFNLFRAQNSCVMAPYVGGEMAMPRQTPQIGGYPGRRPSKVQFEFPSPGPYAPPLPSPLGLNTLPPVPASPQPGPTTDLESGTVPSPSWAGFSFPARSPPGSTTPGAEANSDLKNAASHLPKSVPSMPINMPQHRMKETRRSSLAKSRDYAYPSGSPPSVPNPLQGEMGIMRDPLDRKYSQQTTIVSAGVGEWDPDWLLILLRNKLRADA
jgi:hypothetical protein